MKSILTLLILIGLTLNVNAKYKLGYCYYFNDPWLIPFTASPGDPQNVYFCHNNCTEIMVKNKYVEILVTADPQGAYPIVSYTVIFYPASPYLQPCVLTDSIANPSSPAQLVCQVGSPVSSTSSFSSYHHTHLTANIQVNIVKMGSWFNIQVAQSYNLIQASTGVCVKWDCDKPKGEPRGRKKRQDDLDAIFLAIIETYIEAAKQVVSNGLDENLVELLRTAVLNDLRNTLNPAYAETIVYSILQDSVNRSEGNAKQLAEADDTARRIICNIADKINAIIDSAHICDENEKTLKCLQPTKPQGCDK